MDGEGGEAAAASRAGELALVLDAQRQAAEHPPRALHVRGHHRTAGTPRAPSAPPSPSPPPARSTPPPSRSVSLSLSTSKLVPRGGWELS